MSTFSSRLRVSGRLPDSARLRRGPVRAMICSTAVALVASAGLALAAPAQAAGGQVLLGSAGDVAAMERGTGQQMASHTYSVFSGRVPTADMITVSAGSTSWRTVANAGRGSSLYNDIVRWAQTMKSRQGTTLLAYHHEPESSASAGLGSSSDFVAAYRHVVQIFRSQGVNNVRWVWQMTAYSFKTKPSDRRYAAKWYPGDAYVDVVGGDGYNWGSCYGHGGAWLSMASFTDPILSFARAHGKQASLPEFGAAPDARRAQWLRDSHNYMSANRNTLTSVFYFNRGSGPGCAWKLTKSTEFTAYGDMARDTAALSAAAGGNLCVRSSGGGTGTNG